MPALTHAHTQIREAVVTALTGLTTTGSRVFPNRLYSLAAADLPGLRVFTDEDAVEAETIHTPHVQSHTLSVLVECCGKASNGLDDTCDQISLEVEKALAPGLTVGGVVLYPTLTALRYQDEPGVSAVGVKQLEFSVTYSVLNNAPETLI